MKHHVLFDHTRRYELYFGVVMPDHVHILLRPLPNGRETWFGLPEILRGIKGSSARSINTLLNRSGSVWQDEYFDRLIRDEKELHEK
ncbi:MAG: transposase [Bacteroidetes bacterium]|nr:transposase [Bacteroidota bacterium]